MGALIRNTVRVTANQHTDRMAAFWKRVRKRRCWKWTGAITETGYGVLQVNGRKTYAHRFVYERLIGRIPVGLVIDHLCRVRSCVNPAHMEPVTNEENLRRGVEARRHARSNMMAL